MPLTIPTLAQMYCTASMSGNVSGAVQSVANPSDECICDIAGAHERIQHAIHPRHADVRAIELLLHDDVVVTIARLESCYARLARFTLMISRPQAATRQVRDVPVVFHSLWFSSFLHGEYLFLFVDANSMQYPLPTLAG